MKKTLCILFSATLLLITACRTQISEESKNSSFREIKSLFIINPTSEDKPLSEEWITINKSSRNADETVFSDISSSKISFSQNLTPVFAPDYSNLAGARAAAIIKPTIKFKIGQKHSFQNNFDSFLSTTKLFTCVGEGEHCYIWTCDTEEESLKLTKDEIDEFAKKFDEIYVKEIALCGPKYDGTNIAENVYNIIAPNSKISIIFNDIENDKGAFHYGGYYTLNDMMAGSTAGANGIEAIHLDSYGAKTPKYKNYMFSTLAHEFNHKLNYDNKYIKYGLAMDLWYTEMLSMLIEDFFYEDVGISAIDSSQARLALIVDGKYTYGFKNWVRTNPVESYKYANAYFFGAFLARNYGGAKLIHEICTNEYVNEESVVAAVNKINNTNKTFEDLLQELPTVLINLDNQNPTLPSLNKKSVCQLDNLEGYEYKLSPINLSIFEKLLGHKIQLVTNDINQAAIYPLNAYGFQFYSFENPTNLDVIKKDFLIAVGNH